MMNDPTQADVGSRSVVSTPAGFVPLDPDAAGTLTSAFERQVRALPEHPAVVTRDSVLTYAELDGCAAAIADRILSLCGSAPGRVGLLFGQEPLMIAAVLGALRAGKAYVALDASYPTERLRFMLEDAGAELLLVAGHLRGLAGAVAPANLAIVDAELCASQRRAAGAQAGLDIAPDRPAYLLYTSGSTGRPKGVLQTHRNVLHHMAVWTNNLKIGSSDRVSLQSAYGWDSAVQDTFGALLNGAALYPVSPKQETLDSLLDWYLESRISVYHSTLPIFRGLAKAARAKQARWTDLRVGALGGDPIHRTDVELFFALAGPAARLVNAYGATESSSALLQVLGPGTQLSGEVVALGAPVERTAVLLASEDGRVLDGSGEGEIVIRSSYVASYWGQAAAPPSRVVPEPGMESLSRYYTGDLARRDESGVFHLMGRKDFQVKIRGIRVELGEVEGSLKHHRAVEDAVVTAREDESHERFLVAHWVPRAGMQAAVEDLRAFLLDRLPEHAVPTRFVMLAALPLTPNGKVDRKQLPDPDTSRPALRASFAAPTSQLETAIAEIWKEVLRLDQVGVDDNFFDLGGNSLRIAIANQLINSRVGRPVTMVAMYRFPTIRSLVRMLEDGPGAAAASRQVTERAEHRAELRKRAFAGVARRQQ